jgi:Ca-activated chloride channel family protein
VLRGSEYKGDATYAMVMALAKEAQGEDTEGYRREFISMVDRARTLSAGGETVLQQR